MTSTRTKMNGAQVTQIATHVPIDLVEELKRVAHTNDRSVSGQVLHYIRRGLLADQAPLTPQQREGEP